MCLTRVSSPIAAVILILVVSAATVGAQDTVDSSENRHPWWRALPDAFSVGYSVWALNEYTGVVHRRDDGVHWAVPQLWSDAGVAAVISASLFGIGNVAALYAGTFPKRDEHTGRLIERCLTFAAYAPVIAYPLLSDDYEGEQMRGLVAMMVLPTIDLLVGLVPYP